MGSKFNAEVHSREGITYLKLLGVIDEDNDLTGLESKLPAGTLVINLSDVDRINSCGVRDWVNWLGRLEKNGARSVFVECSPPIVSQINLVHNFTGNGTVRSFYAPYFCPRCEKEKLLLLETRNLVAGGPPFTAPTCRCDECDGPMEFDDMEESYFAFLNNTKKVLGDPSFENTMREIAAASEGGGRMRMRNTGAGMAGGTNPSGSNPGTPSMQPPSAQSPAHRTPTATGRTPPGSTPTGRMSTGPGTPMPSASPSNPAIAVQPLRSEQSPPTAQPQIQAPVNNGAQESPLALRPPVKPAPRNTLPWILLGMFLLAAAALLLVVLMKK